MTNSRRRFNDIAKANAPKYPPPFSLPLTFAERAKLDALAGGKPLGQYIREELLEEQATPRKRRIRRPVKNAKELAKAIAALGQSRLSSNVNQLAKAVHMGALPVTPETEADLKQACADISEIRSALMKGLGFDGGRA